MYSLEIKNLKVKVENKNILKGVSLQIKPGETHALMGPNGSGKSTLASVIMGHPKYEVTGGAVKCYGRNILKLSPDKRAVLGLFLSFQYPVEVAGLSLEHFLRAAYNNLHPKKKLAAPDFHQLYVKKMELLGVKKEFSERGLNEGFSGGERKKVEILQMAVLEPKVAVLDETDSGLDIDALKTVASGVNRVKNKKLSVLIITHYFRILRYIKPDYVHIMIGGKIVKSGKKDLATQVERRGYDWLRKKS